MSNLYVRTVCTKWIISKITAFPTCLRPSRLDEHIHPNKTGIGVALALLLAGVVTVSVISRFALQFVRFYGTRTSIQVLITSDGRKRYAILLSLFEKGTIARD